MSAVILLAVLSLISIGLSVWLAVWLWRQGGRLNKIGSAAAVGVAICLVAVWWILVGYLYYSLPINY